MSENPLAGLSIPSLGELAEQVVRHLGIGILDLSNPLQRRRLQNAIQEAIGMALNYELERSLKTAAERSVEHVFQLMRDPDYQSKRKKYRDHNRKVRAERRAEERVKKEAADCEARMDYSKRRLTVTDGSTGGFKGPIQ